MSDVRADINRAIRKADDRGSDPATDVAKGAAIGAALGAAAVPLIKRYLRGRNLAQKAIDHVRVNDAVHDAVKGQSNFDRFRSAQKARRK